MAIAAVDTLKLSKTLKATGFPDNQAEALATAFAEIVQVNFKELATKDEIDQLAKSFKEELDRVAKATKADLAALREELDRVVKELRTELERTKTELKRDIADVRTAFTSEMKLLKTELMNEISSKHDKTQSDIYHIKWMFGVLVTLTLGLLVRILLFPLR